MNTSHYKNEFDDDGDYDLRILVRCEKTYSEFLSSLQVILAPTQVHAGGFSLGAIECTINERPESIPRFPGIDDAPYNFEIVVPISTAIIWGYFDVQFALALTQGMRKKFLCEYLLVADDDYFVMQSGTSKPICINRGYPPWNSGILNNHLVDYPIVEYAPN